MVICFVVFPLLCATVSYIDFLETDYKVCQNPVDSTHLVIVVAKLTIVKSISSLFSVIIIVKICL